MGCPTGPQIRPYSTELISASLGFTVDSLTLVYRLGILCWVKYFCKVACIAGLTTDERPKAWNLDNEIRLHILRNIVHDRAIKFLRWKLFQSYCLPFSMTVVSVG